MEEYLDWYNLSDKKKVRFATAKLKGTARLWWGTVQERLIGSRRPDVETWEDMKTRLKYHFLPSDYAQTMYLKMIKHQQDNKTVQDYTEEFINITIHSNKVALYHGGLQCEIQKEMIVARTGTMDETYQIAEESLKPRSESKPSSSQYVTQDPSSFKGSTFKTSH